MRGHCGSILRFDLREGRIEVEHPSGSLLA